MVYVAGDSPKLCRNIIYLGGRLDWSNMTSDRGYWSDPAKKSSKKILSHKDLTLKRLQFSDFKFKINVCHPREMDVVEAEMTKWVTLPTCEISIREERDETWQVGVYRSLFVGGWAILNISC